VAAKEFGLEPAVADAVVRGEKSAVRVVGKALWTGLAESCDIMRTVPLTQLQYCGSLNVYQTVTYLS